MTQSIPSLPMRRKAHYSKSMYRYPLCTRLFLVAKRPGFGLLVPSTFCPESRDSRCGNPSVKRVHIGVDPCRMRPFVENPMC